MSKGENILNGKIKKLAKGGEQKEEVAGSIFLKLSLDIDIYIA